MTDFMKVLREMPLTAGSHHVPENGACVMEKVAILWGLHNGEGVVWTDFPECTNEEIARCAQRINDRLENKERQQLNALIPRLLRARRTQSDNRVNIRLAIWAIRQAVLLLAKGDARALCERVIIAAEVWLETKEFDERLVPDIDGAITGGDQYTRMSASNAIVYDTLCACRNLAKLCARGVYSRKAVSDCLYAVVNAITHSGGDVATKLIHFLDGLLDAWEEAVTKEGEDLYIPREWEDEALAFVAEFMAEKGEGAHGVG